uniref:Helically-extended SH3 domain-containing protein n=1 Tax=Amphiprion percula TaxID=161767 RepID=A0A3P8S4K3_AMPPE
MERQKKQNELKKNFQYEGSLRVLHTMMVDPNSVIKKPGAKDLHVVHGEILDVIQLTNSKKALCRNQYGKCTEGDIYDDVDYPGGKFEFSCSIMKSMENILQ